MSSLLNLRVWELGESGIPTYEKVGMEKKSVLCTKMVTFMGYKIFKNEVTKTRGLQVMLLCGRKKTHG